MSREKATKVMALQELQDQMSELGTRYAVFLPMWLRRDMAEFRMRVTDLRVIVQKELEEESRHMQDLEDKRRAADGLKASPTFKGLDSETRISILRELGVSE